jgi:hypothetical protein
MVQPFRNAACIALPGIAGQPLAVSVPMPIELNKLSGDRRIVGFRG